MNARTISSFFASSTLLLITWLTVTGAGIIVGDRPVPEADDGRAYHWAAWLGRNIDAGDVFDGNRGSADYGGPLKYGHNLDYDTTTAGPDGWWLAESTVVSEITFVCDPVGAVDCTLDVYVNRNLGGPALALSWPLSGSQAETSKVGLFLPDSVRLTMYVRGSGTDLPDRPMVRLRAHRFQ
jgi:hypothetical protein